MRSAPPGWALVLYAGERWRAKPTGRASARYVWIEQGPINDPVGKWVHIRTLTPVTT